jgi:hypothetical protein
VASARCNPRPFLGRRSLIGLPLPPAVVGRFRELGLGKKSVQDGGKEARTGRRGEDSADLYNRTRLRRDAGRAGVAIGVRAEAGDGSAGRDCEQRSLREHGYTRRPRRPRQDVHHPEWRSVLERNEITDLDRRWRRADADVIKSDGVPDDNADSELIHGRNRGIQVGLAA